MTGQFQSILNQLGKQIDDIGSEDLDTKITNLMHVNNHVLALEETVNALKLENSNMADANDNIGEYNELITEEKNKLNDEIKSSKRIIQMAEYEYERNKEFKNMFKRMSYICLVILIIVFLQRRFSFLQMPGNFLIIGLGAYLVIYIITRAIHNFKRYNINYYELHKAHSERKN